MTPKGDEIFKEKLTGGLKNDTRNLVNFYARSQKAEDLHFDGLLFSITYKVSVKKSTEELGLMTLKKDPKLEEKLTFCLNNYMRDLVNLTRAAESLKICALM